MAEKVVSWLEKLITRRSALGKVGLATLGAVLGSVGLARPAAALRNVYCCTLCARDCTPLDCTGCRWNWFCCYGAKQIECSECYHAGASCDGSCNSVECSNAFVTNSTACMTT
jgi:hypothetical protein